METTMETEKIQDIKSQIIELLANNQDGLTMHKIAIALGLTTYMLIRELSTLEAKGEIYIINVGASKLVKLTQQ